MTNNNNFNFSIKDKIIAITGACGTLGNEYVNALIENDAVVLMIDRSQQNPVEKAKRLASDHGKIVFGYECDLTSEDNIKSTILEIEKNFTQLDVVINNAAVTGEDLLSLGKQNAFPTFENYPLELWDLVIKINLTAPFLIARESYRLLKKSKNASLINVSSIYGVVAPDHRIYEDMEFSSFAAYSASKSGVHGLTKWLSTYWGKKNIRVNTLSPGGVDNNHNKEFKNRYSHRVPLGRMANPDDMLGTVIYLASDASKYCTGHNFIVDGGLSVW